VSTEGRVRAYGGERRLVAGETVDFAFEVLLTPCKPLDTSHHWEQRYYQVGYPSTQLIQPDAVAATGATVLNIHQGVDGGLNPYINYPFQKETMQELGSYVDRAHAEGLSVKAYYTVRELSSWADELWVLRSLGDEVLASGRGGGDPWTSEHLVDGYAACWQNPLSDGTFDAALCNKGLSRWVNYYVEGLRTLLRPPVRLDGIYYDGIGFGRHTMRRVRRMLQTEKGVGKGLIDLHCGNNFPGATYGHVSPALQFMHLMPYIDSLWFGEGFDYSNSDDAYWLVEVSGIPFGLMGDMMRVGHTWRGMLYGATARYLDGGVTDPSPLWRLWDSFGMANATMIGYWDPSPPVAIASVWASADTTGAMLAALAQEGTEGASCNGVKVTTYVRRSIGALIAIASWAAHDQSCELAIDWKALGLRPTRSRLHAPDLAHLGQAAHEVDMPGLPAKQQVEAANPAGPTLRVRAHDGGLYLLEGR